MQVAEKQVVHTLDSEPTHRRRLGRPADALRTHAEFLMDQVSLRSGDEVIDLGCGPSGILDLLADRVGPCGRVVGIDANPHHVARARAFVDRWGLAHVSVEVGDAARTGLPSASYDVAHAQLVQIDRPDPAALVTEMVRLAKPGGWVVISEAGVYLGGCLSDLFHEAGLVNVHVDIRATRAHKDVPSALTLPRLLFMTIGRKA